MIELLAVIAVVGILASLLLPVLCRGQQAARRALCLSNLHQFSVAVAAYAADHQGVPHFWDWLHGPRSVAMAHDVTKGTLYPYIKNKAVYLCPTDKSTLGSRTKGQAPAAGSTREYSYAMNCVLCHQNDPSKFCAPPRTVLWLEANLEAGDQTGTAGPVAGPSAARVTPPISTRHHGRAHLLFADLHVQRVESTTATALTRSKRFWLPTDDDPFNLSPSLPDP